MIDNIKNFFVNVIGWMIIFLPVYHIFCPSTEYKTLTSYSIYTIYGMIVVLHLLYLKYAVTCNHWVSYNVMYDNKMSKSWTQWITVFILMPTAIYGMLFTPYLYESILVAVVFAFKPISNKIHNHKIHKHGLELK